MSISSVKNSTIDKDSIVSAQIPNPPKIINYGVDGLDDTALDIAGGQTVLINGSNFQRGATVTLNGIAISVVTWVSASQLSFTSPANSAGTYQIYVVNTDGGTAIYLPGIVYSTFPTWSTPTGTLGSYYETKSISNTVVASGDAPVTYSLVSGSLPTGATLSSGGIITGTAPADSGSATYTFTVKADDAQLQSSTRSFSLTINTDVVTWVTPSSGATITLDGTSYSQALSATDAAGYSVSYSANTLPTGLSLSSGTISGTPTVDGTTSTALTATAATTNRTATNTITWVVVLGDAFWKYATLLLTADSAIETQSFVSDNSINNSQLTVVGDTRAQSFNPYQHGYYSNYFDGTGDYLSLTGTDLSSGNFTIEFWVNFSSFTTAAPHIFNFGTNVSNRYNIWRNNTTGKFSFNTANTDVYDTKDGTTSPVINTWYHVALVSNSGTRTMYINGIAEVTSTSAINSGTNWSLGFMQFTGAASDYLTGYISNFRVLKGTALYTSNFTPTTTPFTAVANTVLLTCQSNGLVDNSVSNYTLTKNGDTTVSSANPFTTVYQAGTQYYSTKFDGSSDYLSTSNTLNLNGDFTIEFWVYFNSVSSGYQFALNDGTHYLGLNNFLIELYNGTSSYFNNGGSPYMSAGNWYHIAICRSGSTVSIYHNGNKKVMSSGETNSNAFFTANPLTIGGQSGTQCINGYLSNFRILKGTALYSSSFTPSTTPLTAVANTVLLTCQDSTFKDNSVNNFIITGNGDAKPLAVSPFTPSSYTNTPITTYGSGYFDGTGDYLIVPNNVPFNTGDFTIECWIYPTVAPTAANGWLIGQPANNGFVLFLNQNTSTVGFSFFGVSQLITGTNAVKLNSWTHLTVCRNGTTLKSFINGVQETTATNSSNFSISSSVSIGINTSTPAEKFIGYISDIRIVKGTALYTSNFVPQFTSPLTNVTNTQLLTLQTNGSHNNSTFKDSSSFNNLITRTGNVTNGTFSPYGDNWSVYFDGSSSLSFPTSTNYQFGTNTNFTIECWWYLTADSAPDNAGNRSAQFISCESTTAGTSTGWLFGFAGDANNTGTNFKLQQRTAGTITYAITYTPATPISKNTWHHGAVCRSGNTFSLYLDGVRVAYDTPAAQTFTSTNALLIAKLAITSYPQQPIGYVSNIRIVKGTALYSNATISVPTSPLTSVANTVLLIGNNNKISDNSPFNNAVTITGTPSIQKFSPFSTVTVPKYYSTYFDGTGDYINTASSSACAMGTSDFTIEFWAYFGTAPIETVRICGNLSTSTWSANNWVFQPNSANRWAFGWYNNATPLTGSSIVSTNTNTWYHVAVTRLGNLWTLWVNGVADATLTSSAALDNGTSSQIYIGASGPSSDIKYAGYVSNFRMVKGTALYTANFSPSVTPLTTVSGTGLLTCQDNIFKDNSTNNFIVTGNGDAKPILVSPFTPTVSAVTSYSPTTFGGSMYFDGTGDSLSAPLSSAFQFGTNDFTIECWAYFNSFAGSPALIDLRNATATAVAPLIYTSTTGAVYYHVNGAIVITGSSLTLSNWNHLAVVRQSAVTKLYINGVASGSTYSDTNNYVINAPVFGKYSDTTAGYFNGYLADIRLVKGSALYTSNFYPGSTPLTPVRNSTLLLNGTSGGVIDATRTVDLETVADAKVTNFSPYNGSYYSNYFNGSGDYLDTTCNLSTNSFTIECWAWCANIATGNQQTIASQYVGVPAGRWGFGFSTTGSAEFYVNGLTEGNLTIIHTATLQSGTWVHFVITRDTSNNFKLWVNGVASTAAIRTGSLPNITLSIGYLNSGVNFFTGYVSNFRIVSGTALYTETFTPSTTPLTAIAGTILLTCQSNTFKDNSSNNFAITKNGDTKVKSINPFQVNTGLSYYFDGTGDYLTVSSGTNFSFSTGDFTVECWFYTTITSSSTVCYINGNSGTYAAVRVGTQSNQVYLLMSTNGSSWAVQSGLVGSAPINSWNHIAITRSSGTVRIFVNGTVLATTYSLPGALMSGTLNTIGAYPVSPYEYFNGYIADLRITSGYARTITVPTTPYKLK